MGRIAILLTSRSQFGDDKEKKTGFWWEEMAAPYWTFSDAGNNVDLFSVAGGEPPVDPGSASGAAVTDLVKRFQEDAAAMAKLKATKPIKDFKFAEYDAIFLAGGHGTCWDFDDAAVVKAVEDVFQSGKAVAAVCHGPTGLVNAKDKDGKPIVSGRKVTGFSDTEEAAIQLTEKVPYLLETKLTSLGGVYSKSGNWQSYALRDGNLITGQNPASSLEVAKLTLEALSISPFKGKVVVVAGASKNLGADTAKAFGRKGAKVVVHYNSAGSAKDASQVVEYINTNGGAAIAVQADFTKVKEISALFAKAVETYGKVDISVNCVGTITKKPIVAITEEEFDSNFSINTKAAFFFMQEAAKNTNDGGKIINVLTSLIGAYTPFYSVYAGSKAAVEHFTRGLSKELMARKISVNNVAPGPLDTPFFYGQETEQAIAYCKNAAMGGQLGDVKDIVPSITFLAGEGWWMTGQTLFINGGFVTR